MSATEIAAKIAAGELTALEVAEAACARIEAINPLINAYVHYDREQVLADARELDAKQAAGEPLGPLHGVPFAIKCLTEVAGLPNTHSMTPFADEIGKEDAVVVARLKAAGGLFTGLTNAPEGGYYGGTDSHLYGPTHNPFKHGHTAGGSSGGSAAAVAAGLVPIAEGADGAGSVRIPSAMCGVVGLKPSLGRIPHALLQTKFETWVFHGPITRTVEDAALMFDVMTGFDPSDPMSLPREVESYAAELDETEGEKPLSGCGSRTPRTSTSATSTRRSPRSAARRSPHSRRWAPRSPRPPPTGAIRNKPCGRESGCPASPPTTTCSRTGRS